MSEDMDVVAWNDTLRKRWFRARDVHDQVMLGISLLCLAGMFALLPWESDTAGTTDVAFVVGVIALGCVGLAALAWRVDRAAPEPEPSPPPGGPVAEVRARIDAAIRDAEGRLGQIDLGGLEVYLPNVIRYWSLGFHVGTSGGTIWVQHEGPEPDEYDPRWITKLSEKQLGLRAKAVALLPELVALVEQESQKEADRLRALMEGRL